jgi:hypothetical protein
MPAVAAMARSRGIFNIIRENLARLKAGQPAINRVYGPERARQLA